MKKVFLCLICAVLLLSACAPLQPVALPEPEIDYFAEEPEQLMVLSEPEQQEPEPEPTPEAPEPPENEALPTAEDAKAPHPFVAALERFIADANGEAVAFLVDVDGNGTEGMLAIYTLWNPPNSPNGTLFYLHNGTLYYKDVGMQGAGVVTAITAGNNRAVGHMSDGGQRSFTLFGIENGRLAEILSIYLTSGYRDNYYLYAGPWLEGFENRRPITQEEYNTISTEHGLDNLRSPWWDLEDESSAILAMIVE